MRGWLRAGGSGGSRAPAPRPRTTLLAALWLLGSAAALVGFGAAASAAPGSGDGGAPFPIRSASLTQDGQQLRWQVALGHDFSGAAFARGRRTLCLLIERRSSGTVTGRLCVVPSRGAHSGMRLTFAAVTGAGPGRAVAVSASISRGARDALTAVFEPTSFDPGYRSLYWQVQSTLSPAACSPPTTGPPTTGPPTTTTGPTTTTTGPPTTTGAPTTTSCTVTFPAGPTLTRLHTPKLVGCVPAGSSLVFSGSSRRHEIALTFDDGPWGTPPSMAFVNLLARYHVPATFFEIGSQISQYDPKGAIERAMLADGDMIGDHTWTHPVMTGLSPAHQTYQLESTADAIRHATGFTPCLWRPPYGAYNRPLLSLARGLGMLTIYWSVDTRDWSLPGVGAIEQAALSGAANGGIILMHFGGGSRYETYDALPTIITTLRARGYQFVNVAQLLGLRMIYR